VNIKVIVATHKPYQMPDDPMYLPLHVGKNEGEGFGIQGDDTGDNISYKNPNYCELTGLYWAWKNLDADAIGLVHYRRHFKIKLLGEKWTNIMEEAEVERLLCDADIILPRKRNYYVETIYDQYIHRHHKEGLELAREYIFKLEAKYETAWNKLMSGTSIWICNMFIMQKDYVSSYCEWLFDVLGYVEAKIDTSRYSKYESRVFAFLGERLLNVWVIANALKVKEINVVNLENVDWVKKGYEFLKRKIAARVL
jgi:hypothetical protein